VTTPRYRRASASKIEQTAILRDVEIPEIVARRRDRVRAKFTSYSWVVVLNQDCDLDLDHHARHGTSPKVGGNPVRKDKLLGSLQLCRAFPQDELLAGTYLRPLAEATKFGTSESRTILANRHERFHLLSIEAPLLATPLILDFKLIVPVAADYLERWIRGHRESRVAVLRPPFRDRLTQRFSNYYSRIAEPGEDE